MISTILDVLFEEITDDELIAMRTIKDRKVLSSEYVATVGEADDYAKKNRDLGNVYFGTCTRNKNKPQKEFVAKAYCVWADIDIGSSNQDTFAKTKYLKESKFVLPPSMAIDSGGGIHLYWLLHEATEELDVVEETCEVIAAAVNGDSVADVTRLLRVDNTFNYKYEHPRPIQFLKENMNRYSLQDLNAAAIIDDKILKRILTGSKAGFKSRSERDWKVVWQLVMMGFTDAGIEAVYENNKIGDKSKESPVYLKHTIEKVRKRTGIKADAIRAAKGSTEGVFEKDDCYIKLTEAGAIRLSTFTFNPTTLLRGNRDVAVPQPDVMIGTMRAEGKVWENVYLTKEAFTRVETLLRQLPVIEWQWLGKDSEVRSLLPYLVTKLKKSGASFKTGVTQLGQYQDVWVGSHQTIYPDRGVLGFNDSEIVLLPSKQERPEITYTEDLGTDDIRKFLKLIPRVNRPEVIWPIVSWWATCALKVKLETVGYRFPSLNLFGTRGSGKTSIITQVIQPLSGYVEPRTYDCNTTQFVMLSLLGASLTVPIAFSEYRRTSLKVPDRILRYLLLLYDTGHDPRGRADQTVIDYALTAPMSLDGEDAVSDPAALERIIQVNLHPEDIAEDSEAFTAFKEVTTEVNLKAVGTSYIQFCLTQKLEIEKARGLIKESFPDTLPDRVRRNLTTMVTGLLNLSAWAAHHKVDFPEITSVFVHDVFKTVLDDIINVDAGRSLILADVLVEDMINEAARTNGVDTPFVFKYDSKKNVVWFHLSTTLGWWYKHRRQQDKATLDTAAIKSQLKERFVHMNGEGPDVPKGQYVVDAKPVYVDGSTRHCYGISIEAAKNSGLDIPDAVGSSFMFTVASENIKSSKVDTSKEKQK